MAEEEVALFTDFKGGLELEEAVRGCSRDATAVAVVVEVGVLVGAVEEVEAAVEVEFGAETEVAVEEAVAVEIEVEVGVEVEVEVEVVVAVVRGVEVSLEGVEAELVLLVVTGRMDESEVETTEFAVLPLVATDFLALIAGAAVVTAAVVAVVLVDAVVASAVGLGSFTRCLG